MTENRSENIDPTKRGFLLQQNTIKPSLFRASDNTVYERGIDGALRCVNKVKLSKKERKALKNARATERKKPVEVKA